jgi:hypothetical protein
MIHVIQPERYEKEERIKNWPRRQMRLCSHNEPKQRDSMGNVVGTVDRMMKNKQEEKAKESDQKLGKLGKE